MYNSTHFLTSALDGGEWSVSRSRRCGIERKHYQLDHIDCSLTLFSDMLWRIWGKL